MFEGALAAGILAVSQLSSASYSVDNWTMDGGGTSVAISSSYSASMTISQPDASGVLSSASYSLVGGFWDQLDPPPPKPNLLFRDGFESLVAPSALNNQYKATVK